MNKLNKTLIAIALLISVASAAMVTECFEDVRSIEVEPWMSFEVNYDPRNATYGDTLMYDYINITSHKKYSSTCEIQTEIFFNGEELIDQAGIRVDYSVESGSGTLVDPKDINNNGMPEVAVFGMQDLEGMGDPDGSFTIRRNTLINEDLVPGSYKIITTLIPYQGNA